VCYLVTNDALIDFIQQFGQSLVCLDIETTGAHTERDCITKIDIVTLFEHGSRSAWSF